MILNSKHYIRQFVIMARHPEAKDYEMAVQEEKHYSNSLWKHIETQELCTTSEIRKSMLLLDEIYQKTTTIEDFLKVLTFQFIGRPITALDVCWALNKKYKQEITFYPCTDSQQGIYSEIIGNERYEHNGGFIKFEVIKPDGTHTTLEDWSDMVCEKIVELI